MIDLPRLQGRDRLFIFLTALAGGIALALIPHAVSGSEATLAQSLREMRQAGQWLVPTIAGRAQFDLPLLPQWCGLLLGSFTPDADPLLLIRISAALAAAFAVAITSELTAALRGRSAGNHGRRAQPDQLRLSARSLAGRRHCLVCSGFRSGSVAEAG